MLRISCATDRWTLCLIAAAALCFPRCLAAEDTAAPIPPGVAAPLISQLPGRDASESDTGSQKSGTEFVTGETVADDSDWVRTVLQDETTSASEDDADETEEESDTSKRNLEERVLFLEEELARLGITEGDGSRQSYDYRLSALEDTFSEFEGSGSKFVETLARNSRRIFNGRVHMDWWQFPESSPGINFIENGDPTLDPENRALVRRARLGVRGTVKPDNISYRLDMEFSGVDGGQIRDAWLGWDELPVLNTLRIGNQKRPYGLDHLNSSNFMTFLERPFVVDAFNRENRRLGLMSYGSDHDNERNWQVGVFNMVTLQDNNQIVGDDPQIEVAGRIANTVWYDASSNGRGYAHVGLAGSAAFPDGFDAENQAFFRTRPEGRTGIEWLDTGMIVGARAYQLIAFESVVNIGAWQLTSELMHVSLQREAGFGPDVNLHGGYISLSYFLTGEHIPWSRTIGILGRVQPYENFFCLRDCDGRIGRGLGAWQVAMRLSRADFNDKDILGGVGESLTLALNWYMNANTRLQFNYIWGQVDNRRIDLGNNLSTVVGGTYQIAGTRFVIDF